MSISVLANLTSRSSRSLADIINHNCVIDNIQFVPKYGVIFSFVKVSTGASFNIDILSGDDNQIVISEGIGYRRYYIGTEVLYALRPSVRTIMATTLKLLPVLREVNPELELADLNGLPTIADAVADELLRMNPDAFIHGFYHEFKNKYSNTDSEEEKVSLVID